MILSIDWMYLPPSTTTAKRTIRLSPKRTVKANRAKGSTPGIRLQHARVMVLTIDQAHDVIELILSVVEQTEDYLEKNNIEPYPS